MKKLAIAALVMGTALAVGCRREPAQDVQAQREEVMQERQELAETRVEEERRLQEDTAQMRQEHQEELAGRQQEYQEEIASEREDVTQAERELAEERQERQQELSEEQQAVGGAGEEGAQTVTGTVEAKQADKLTLKTDRGEQELVVTTDTELTHMGRDIEIIDLPEGAEVRASYKLENNRFVADKVEVLRTQP